MALLLVLSSRDLYPTYFQNASGIDPMKHYLWSSRHRKAAESRLKCYQKYNLSPENVSPGAFCLEGISEVFSTTKSRAKPTSQKNPPDIRRINLRAFDVDLPCVVVSLTVLFMLVRHQLSLRYSRRFLSR